MENVKNRVSLHLTTDETNAVKWFSKINFKTSKNFDNLHLIEMYKQEIIYDKPIYVGTSILDLSKLHMMNFHYGVIEKQFKGQYELLYGDTDSFIYLIHHPDIYKWISKNKQHFDLSESLNMDIKNDENKKVEGKFKTETTSNKQSIFIPNNSISIENDKRFVWDGIFIKSLVPSKIKLPLLADENPTPLTKVPPIPTNPFTVIPEPL
jgi:hypothetical protein